MDLEKIRSAIDRIDDEIVKLLSRRLEHALRLKRLKTGIVEPERERQVIEHVRRCSHAVMAPEFTERLYRTIIEESIHIQNKNLRLIGFQGEHGAYSEAAALRYDQSLLPIPCAGFDEVFHEVETGQARLRHRAC